MPTYKEHCEHSQHNLDFLASFFFKNFNDWAVTVMFYAGVHMVEAILEKDHSIHSANHGERFVHLAKLTAFPKQAYVSLKKKAHDSRYIKYEVRNWEIHRLYQESFLKLVHWFNTQVEENRKLDIQACSIAT